VVFAYLGPDTMLPLASVVATVVGMVMMFGRVSLKFALAPFRWFTRTETKSGTERTLRGPTAWRRGKATARVDASSHSRESDGGA
jgi:hypothetical protein